MALGQNLQTALSEPAYEAGGGASMACRVASVVWQDAQSRFQRYSTLVFALALLALAAIVLAIVFFFVADDATGAGLVSLVGGLISGGLAGFIKKERDTARDDRNAAIAIVQADCAGQSAEDVLQTMRL
jgi:hypothetical protein